MKGAWPSEPSRQQRRRAQRSPSGSWVCAGRPDLGRERRPGGGPTFSILLPFRGTVLSVRDLTVVLVDPMGMLTPSIRPALDPKDVRILRGDPPRRVKRAVELERPDLVFFHAEGSVPQLFLFLTSPNQGTPRALMVVRSRRAWLARSRSRPGQGSNSPSPTSRSTKFWKTFAHGTRREAP